MKRIAFSLVSAALLSAAVAPMAKAATFNSHQHAGVFPRVMTSVQTTPTADTDQSFQPRHRPALEQARLNRLDRIVNTNGSLSAYNPQTTQRDLDPLDIASVSPLQQARLNHLDNSN